MANWYCSSVGWTAVAAWAALTAYNVGDIRRQLAAPTVGNERVWRCTTAGTSGAAEPTWTLTQGSTTADGTAVWTEITGSETYDGGTFAAPHARLAAAVATGFAAAGDIVFIDEASAETQGANMGIASIAPSAGMVKVICVASTHSSPPVSADLRTTASVATTGGNIASNISGGIYIYGVKFSFGDATNSRVTIGGNVSIYAVLENCEISMPSTGATSAALATGHTVTTHLSSYVEFRNTNVRFADAEQFIHARGGEFVWNGGSLLGTAPTNLFGQAVQTGILGQADLRGVDLSICGASSFLVNATNLALSATIKFRNCKLATNLGGVITGTLGNGGQSIDLVNTDSTANVTVREEHYQYAGSMVQDTTQTRVGGASDGTTPKSWKVVTLAGASYVRPFKCPPIYQWVDGTGSKTITMYIASGGTLQDGDVGFDLEYLGDAATPLALRVMTAPDVLSAGSNLASDGVSTWNGAGVGTKQKVTKTVTINQKGTIRVRPFVMKPSQTVYIDPLINVA